MELTSLSSPPLLLLLLLLLLLYYYYYSSSSSMMFCFVFYFIQFSSLINIYRRFAYLLTWLWHKIDILLLMWTKHPLLDKYINTRLLERFAPIFYFNCELVLFVNIVNQTKVFIFNWNSIASILKTLKANNVH